MQSRCHGTKAPVRGLVTPCLQSSLRGHFGHGRRLVSRCKRLRSRHETRLCVSAVLQATVSRALQPVPGFLTGAAVCSTVFILGINVLKKGLTQEGILHSWFLGTMVYAAFGWRGFLQVCMYFLAGNVVTKVKRSVKEAEGTAEQRQGRRSIGSVWGSGLAAVVCAIAALTTQHHNLWQVGFVASIVSKLSDTVSSEIGKGYGKTTYLSTSFRAVPRGTEGAVSLEGTLAGILAAIAFTGYSLLVQLVTWEQARLVVLAAVLANYAESVVGALIQGRKSFSWVSNDLVNMAQIVLAAYLAMMFIDF